jgi:hypothetical protein
MFLQKNRKVEKSRPWHQEQQCQLLMQLRNTLPSNAGCSSKYASSAEERTQYRLQDAGNVTAAR